MTNVQRYRGCSKSVDRGRGGIEYRESSGSRGNPGDERNRRGCSLGAVFKQTSAQPRCHVRHGVVLSGRADGRAGDDRIAGCETESA